MGYVRVTLALVVLYWHFGAPGYGPSWHALTSDLAVEGFFLISGFYIFLILETKYTAAKIFYLNRFLRLYPSYLTILVLTAVVSVPLGATAYFLTIDQMAAIYLKMDPAPAAFLIFSNLSMMFQDVVMFLYGDQHPTWTSTFWKEPDATYRLLVLPQAWSISIEIAFYALAPFLVRLRSRSVAVLIVASLLARVVGYALGYSLDPWSHRFFPFELAFFLTGGLMYRASVRYRQYVSNPLVAKAFIGVILAYCAAYGALPHVKVWHFDLRDSLFFLLVTVALPFLYHGEPYRGVSKFLGELSYPLYVNHLFVDSIVRTLNPDGGRGLINFMVSLPLSILLAVAMVKLIEGRVDRLRQKLARGDTAVLTGVLAWPRKNFATIGTVLMLSVITPVVLGMVRHQMTEKRDETRMEHARLIVTALAKYHAINGRFPLMPDNPVDDLAPALVKGGYLQSIPQDPLGKPYRYTTVQHDDGQSYALLFQIESNSGQFCRTGVNVDPGWWGPLPECKF